MPTFTSDGVTLAYDDVQPPGAERTIVLVHGFSSNRKEGWKRTGWYTAMERRRVRCIALDQRGHGESEKLYEPGQYTVDKLARDVLNLLDHLGVERTNLFGYSMGSRTSVEAALLAPERFSNLIIGGVGAGWIDPRPEPGERTGMSMAEAMLADDPATIHPEMLQSFRQFADEQGEDRKALAAFTQAASAPVDVAALGGLHIPTLVVAGQFDSLAKEPNRLAAAFPYGKSMVLPGCDHFSAIAHVSLKGAVFDFLDGLLEDDGFESQYV
jgi:pimeloyl-ACP methyl ester carboxylesterase